MVGLVGMLLIIQPGSDSFLPASIFSVLAVAMFVLRDTSTIPNIAIFNLIKSKKYNAYIEQEKDAKDIFTAQKVSLSHTL